MHTFRVVFYVSFSVVAGDDDGRKTRIRLNYETADFTTNTYTCGFACLFFFTRYRVLQSGGCVLILVLCTTMYFFFIFCKMIFCYLIFFLFQCHSNNYSCPKAPRKKYLRCFHIYYRGFCVVLFVYFLFI